MVLVKMLTLTKCASYSTLIRGTLDNLNLPLNFTLPLFFYSREMSLPKTVFFVQSNATRTLFLKEKSFDR